MVTNAVRLLKSCRRKDGCLCSLHRMMMTEYRVGAIVSPEDGDKKRRIRNGVTCAVILECGIIRVKSEECRVESEENVR